MKLTLTILILIVGNMLYSQNITSGRTDPVLISKPELEYPNEAYMGRVAGKIWLNVLIGLNGIPIKTEIIKREPDMAYLFDNVARKWAMRCRYTPAKDSLGQPILMWLEVPLSFGFYHFTPAVCIEQAIPDYPDEAHEMGLEGWVGLAVLIKSNGEVDHSQIIVVARRPENTSIFEKAAKEAAYHSRYRAAAYEATTVEGWCFIKINFKIPIIK